MNIAIALPKTLAMIVAVYYLFTLAQAAGLL